MVCINFVSLPYSHNEHRKWVLTSPAFNKWGNWCVREYVACSGLHSWETAFKLRTVWHQKSNYWTIRDSTSLSAHLPSPVYEHLEEKDHTLFVFCLFVFDFSSLALHTVTSKIVEWIGRWLSKAWSNARFLLPIKLSTSRTFRRKQLCNKVSPTAWVLGSRNRT